MEVTRIEAAPSKIIDWRRLTAKEIIKYNNDGVEVPPQYLKWAIDFRQDLEKNDKDNTTYEMDQKLKVEENKKEQPIESETKNNEKGTEVSDVESETEPTQAPAEDINNKTPAEKKREEMENAGVSLRAQAKAFTKDSKKANFDDLFARMVINGTEKKSRVEIAMLEAEMQAILSRAESTQAQLKTEIDNINSGNSNKLTFAKINRLQQKLEQYGQYGQNKLAGSEGDLNVYEQIIESKNETIVNAADFGTETSAIGHELLASVNYMFIFGILDYIAGAKAVHTGNKTTDNAIKTDEIKNEATQVNNANKVKVQDWKTRVENTTGVEGFSLKSDSEQTKEDKEKIENQTSATSEANKAGSASLDQVLLAKLRRGQDIEA
jgi:hypothetical protein